MGAITKTVTMCCALAGVAVFSQGPEFAQQYRQRLGGAADELRVVVEDFDRDALESSRTRNEALIAMRRNGDELVRFRSASIEETIGRYEKLRGQQAAFESANPLWRPLLILGSPDQAIATAALQVFEPAVPLNPAGATWGAIGALLAGMTGALATRPFRRRRRQTKANRNEPPLLDEVSRR